MRSKLATPDHDLIYMRNSYYVRNMVNRYTQPDLSQAFPNGDILNSTVGFTQFSTLRPLVKFDKKIGLFEINGILGNEIKQVKTTKRSLLRYGYDVETLTSVTNLNYGERYNLRPSGLSFLPTNTGLDAQLLDRYVSYFFNSTMAYKGRYQLSGSIRWDGSNLFGVTSNQRGVPLWSIGGAWDLGQESFYKWSLLPNLKVRATYGFNGNVDKSVSAFPIARYSIDSQSGLLSAQITNPGNPALRWEKVGIVNLGIDFSFKKKIIEGSIDFYTKKSADLFAFSFIDPTSFYSGSTGASFKQNYASMNAVGVDIELKVNKYRGENFVWSGNYLFNMVKNSVTKYYDDGRGNLDGYFLGRFTKPIVGYPMDVVFSYPWHGLDNEGNPIVYIDDKQSYDYSKYRQSIELEDLVYHGSSVPTVFGAIRQDFFYKRFHIGFNLVYKLRYFYRRESIDYFNFQYMNKGHRDYDKRWRRPGDEKITNVPSLATPIDFNRDLVYGYSDNLIEPGDHLRLQDIVFTYDFKVRTKGIRSLKINGSINNVGILWRKGESTSDPDYPMTFVAPSKSYSVGINLGL